MENIDIAHTKSPELTASLLVHSRFTTFRKNPECVPVYTIDRLKE